MILSKMSQLFGSGLISVQSSMQREIAPKWTSLLCRIVNLEEPVQILFLPTFPLSSIQLWRTFELLFRPHQLRN